MTDPRLDLLDLGCALVPLHFPLDGGCSCRTDCRSPGKHPLRKGSATEDRAALEAIFHNTPLANVAVGLKESRLCELDLDDRDPRDVLDPILSTLYTPTIRSGRGTKYLFVRPQAITPNVNLKLRPGIRAEFRVNGIAVVPPSRHTSGATYAWERSPFDGVTFADPPRELLALLRRLEPPRATSEGTIWEGQRNVTLTALVGGWLAQGLSESEVMAMALEENRIRCQPPVEAREVERIVSSIAGREAVTRTGRNRMSGLVRYTINVADMLDGPAGELDPEQYGYLHRLLCHAWRRDGLPTDSRTALQVAGAPGTPELERLLDDWFPISQDGRRRNLEQELERERLLTNCAVRRNAARRGGEARAAQRDSAKRTG
jgi:hypothetical protein